jgi:hypothetical protein
MTSLRIGRRFLFNSLAAAQRQRAWLGASSAAAPHAPAAAPPAAAARWLIVSSSAHESPQHAGCSGSSSGSSSGPLLYAARAEPARHGPGGAWRWPVDDAGLPFAAASPQTPPSPCQQQQQQQQQQGPPARLFLTALGGAACRRWRRAEGRGSKSCGGKRCARAHPPPSHRGRHRRSLPSHPAACTLPHQASLSPCRAQPLRRSAGASAPARASRAWAAASPERLAARRRPFSALSARGSPTCGSARPPTASCGGGPRATPRRPARRADGAPRLRCPCRPTRWAAEADRRGRPS